MSLLLPAVRGSGQTPPLPDIPIAPDGVPPAPPVAAQPEVGGDKKPSGKGDEDDRTRVIETGPELSLGECIAVAIERSPRLKAVQASIDATAAGYRSLMNFGTVGTLISPDLDIRKQQARAAFAASAGEYQKEYNQVVQDVTRLYYSAVYARQQEALADDIVGRLNELIPVAEELLKAKLTAEQLQGLSNAKLQGMKIGLGTARQQQLLARQGRKQAMAALRQVMAVDDRTFPFRPKDAELPVMAQDVPITKDLVVDLALARRPELALAAAGVDAFRLEVYAQAKIPFRRIVPTLASGADIHAKEIPQAQRGKDYRPGGIIPEMPPQLVGSKYDRVCRAMAFSRRADAIYEDAVTLVRLEAENAFIEFEAASEKVRITRTAYDAGLELEKITEAANASTNAKDQILQGYVAAIKAQSDYVEAVWQYLLALASLERITAGGIRPAFPGR
jgi:outer membrane protein TolC